MRLWRLAPIGVAVACSSFGDAVDEPPATGVDAGMDAPFSEGDAGVDAPVVNDGGACQHSFCVDFESDPASQGMTEVTTGNPFGLERVPGDGRSPNVLHATMPPGQYVDWRYLRKLFSGPAARSVKVGFSFRVSTAPLDLTNFQIATVGWGLGVDDDMISEIQIRLSASVVETKRDEQPDGSVYGTAVPYTPKTWTDALVVLSFTNGNETKATVTIGGVKTFEDTYSASAVAGDIDVGLGLPGANGAFTGTSVIDFDDLWVDIER
jgi:hypothetical protein